MKSVNVVREAHVMIMPCLFDRKGCEDNVNKQRGGFSLIRNCHMNRSDKIEQEANKKCRRNNVSSRKIGLMSLY